MSFEAMAWAVKQECGSAASKLTLLMLANHSNGHTGQCNPRLKTLASECEMRVETLRTHIKNLEDRGLLTVIPQYTDGVQLPNQYRLHLLGGTSENRTPPPSENHKGGTSEKHHPYKQEGNLEEETIREAPRKRVTHTPSDKAITLTAYLESCKANKTKPVPDGHSLRAWAAEAGITGDMLQIAWLQFRERYTEAEKGKGKRYKDWPGHFANAVKANWFKLWFAGDHGMQWSSTGLTHKTVLDARMKKESDHA